MKRFAIFDLDGTLLNTLDDLAAACNAALESQGFPAHPVDAYRMFVGNGVPKLMERILPEPLRADRELLRRMREQFDRHYEIHGQDMTRPYDGIPEMLETMLKRGMKLAVLSNKPHAFTKTLASRYFGGRFAVVYGQRAGYPVKPDGSLVKEVLVELGAGAEETVYLGDSGVDMETAKNGGVFGVGVLWGFRGADELQKNGARALIAHPMEIEQYL